MIQYKIKKKTKNCGNSSHVIWKEGHGPAAWGSSGGETCQLGKKEGQPVPSLCKTPPSLPFFLLPSLPSCLSCETRGRSQDPELQKVKEQKGPCPHRAFILVIFPQVKTSRCIKWLTRSVKKNNPLIGNFGSVFCCSVS